MTSLGLWLPIATAPSSSSSLHSIVKLHSFLWFGPFDTGRRRWVQRTGRWSQVDCFNSIHSVGCYRRLQCLATNGRERESGGSRMFGSSDEEVIPQVPTQLQSVVEGSGAVLVSEPKPIPDLDYLQELLAIQQQGPRAIGFFGTRNMGFMHQQLIEILSYAMVITKNHIFTSGASGTNAAVIRGALRAEKPELLTVILPQSLKMQPPESQELLSKRLVVYRKVIHRLAQCIKHSGVLTYELVQLIFMSIPFSCKNLVEGVYDITGMVKNVIEKPQNDHLPLIEASRLCNMDILSHVQQVICFAFHDSKLLMETCQEAKNLRKIVTLFYLD